MANGSASFSWRYAATGSSESIGSWTNNTGSKVRITSVSVGLGTGNGTFTWGDTVTGDGSAITTSVTVAGYESDSEVVSNAIRPTSGSGGTYPASGFVTKTFYFENEGPVEIASGTTVTFYLSTPSGRQCICANGSTSFTYETVSSTFTVSYDGNGGTGTPATQTSSNGVIRIASGSSMESSTQYTISYDINYPLGVNPASTTVLPIFEGWYTARTGGTRYYSGTNYYGPDSITLYAHWTDPVIADLNFDPVVSVSRPGWEFDGWYSGTTWVDETYQITESQTWVANWTDPTTYTITYSANGGTNAPAATSGSLPLTITTAQPTKSITITLDADGGDLDESSLTRNLAFNGWKDINNNSYAAGLYYNVAADITLYAQWGSATVGELPEPTRSGYTFLGWQFGNVNVTPTMQVSSDVTLKANWSEDVAETYTITYSANGGTNAPAAQTADIGTAITLSTVRPIFAFNVVLDPNGGSLSSPSTVSIAHTFKEWNTSSGGSGTSYQPGDTYSGSSRTLYAIWTYSSTTFATPTREHYTFLGWFTSHVGGTQVTSASTLRNAQTLYAHWQSDGSTYGVARHVKDIYVGVPTQVPVYEGTDVPLTVANINKYFSVLTDSGELAGDFTDFFTINSDDCGAYTNYNSAWGTYATSGAVLVSVFSVTAIPNMSSVSLTISRTGDAIGYIRVDGTAKVGIGGDTTLDSSCDISITSGSTIVVFVLRTTNEGDGISFDIVNNDAAAPGTPADWNISDESTGGLKLVPGIFGEDSVYCALRLGPKQALTNVKIFGQYYTEAVDHIEITVGGNTLLNAGGKFNYGQIGTTQNLAVGQMIWITYSKDYSFSPDNESSTYFVVTCDPISEKTITGYETKNVARHVKEIYVGDASSKAKKITTNFVGVLNT
jgi:uncharacterized repeat protein (TIGR02543 family)